ncbi:GNAT family N-acetyltransferase [Bacillus massilinigeriensis]|uniref:GNAT family N-acetyltransferase n=1 Tax=Bacillus mediterraneensis TaxID=1805474 RepID=UPI0008F8DD57|nr:GNAT family protein [Bacillus mediterraneensis]
MNKKAERPDHSNVFRLFFRLNAVFYRDSEEYVGTTQATIYKESQKASIAYLFSPAYWGRGIAKKAVSTMINTLIQQYGVKSLEAYIDRRNTRSIHLIKGLGFEWKDYITNTDFFKGEASHEFVYGFNVDLGKK